jgi:branched-chain amino acid aminotransferase
MTSPRNVWVNGELLAWDEPHLAVSDRGFQLGDGVFETLRARRGVLVEWHEHCARLHDSAAAIDIRLPYSDEELAAGITALLEDEDVAPTVAIQAWPYAPPAADLLERGVRAVPSAVRRDPGSPLAGIKATSRADYVYAKLEAERAGADDALFLTLQGRVSEGTTANVFCITDGYLLTPPADAAILPGTTRTWLLADPVVRALGLQPQERELWPEDLQTADEAFLSSSVAGIVPLTMFDGRPIGTGRPGPRTIALRAAREAWVDAVSRGRAGSTFLAASSAGGYPPGSPGSPGSPVEPGEAGPADEPSPGHAPLPPADEGVVAPRSRLLVRSALLGRERARELGPEQVWGWAAGLTKDQIIWLGRVVAEVARTAAVPNVERAFGVAWDQGVHLPWPDREGYVGEFAELGVTIGSDLAGRDLRADDVPQRSRGWRALLDFRFSRTRPSEERAFSAIDAAGREAGLGVIACWNVWMAARYRSELDPNLFELLTRPWRTVIGDLPQPPDVHSPS